MTTTQDKKRHTPGPWHVGAGNGEGSIFAENGRTRLEIGGTTLHPIAQMGRGWDEEEDEANARLVAAAPELLEALRWFADELPSIIRTHCPLGIPMSVSKAHDIACAAIAKAEGRVA